MSAVAQRYERAVRRFMVCEEDSREWDRLLDRIEKLSFECSTEEMAEVDKRVDSDQVLRAEIERLATERRPHAWLWSHGRKRYECKRCDATSELPHYQLPTCGCPNRQTVPDPTKVVRFRHKETETKGAES